MSTDYRARMNSSDSPSSDVAQFIYIMGRGFSGSTVLDAILGNAQDIESIGELVSGIGRTEELCSCGVPLRECDFWCEVRSEFVQRSGMDWSTGAAVLAEQAHISRFLKTICARADSPGMQVLARVNNAMIEALRQASGKACIVDSSKEVTRGLFFARFLPGARIIHLVRDPERVLASYLFRVEEGEGFKFLRHRYRDRRLTFLFLALASAGWVLGNLLAELVHLLAPLRVVRVRYEDLCEHPRSELQRMANLIGCDLEHVIRIIEQGRSMSIGHNTGGNRWRLAGRFRFDPQVGKKRDLPRHYRVMVRVLTWPLMLWYGYAVF
jgi:hypothetical protein